MNVFSEFYHQSYCFAIRCVIFINFVFLYFKRFRKKTGIVETLTSMWYRQPSDSMTEGK